MTGRFPTAWVDEVYARADIVDVVSAYLPLKRQGRNHVGLCPFHNEKTPSFSVNRENNVYHCFGCKAGGNVVQFVMEMERLNYPDALMHLANSLNIPPPVIVHDPRAERERSRRDRLREANRVAARFYHDRLYSPKGAAALAYLHSRGLEDGVIKRFGVGFSGEDWTELLDELTQKGYTKEELAESGLVHIREKGAYDVFRGRVMFPIIDMYGHTQGFGGRAVGDIQPKYLNTQDTLLFNKRQGVYAINLLRRQRDLKQVILVEGYMDVMALSQVGIQGAVATLGTALTPEQARLIKRFAPEVWIAFDGDQAGQLATERALEVFGREGIPARVLAFPEGLDPDDLLRQGGRAAFDDLIPVSAMRFRLDRLKAEADLSTEEGVAAYSIQACAMVSTVAEPVEREQHIRRLAVETGFQREVIAQQVEKAARQPDKRKPAGQEALRPARRSRARSSQNEASHAERMLLTLLATQHLPQGMVKAEEFSLPLFQGLARQLLDGHKPARMLAELEDREERTIASEVFGAAADITREQALTAAEECMLNLRMHRLTAEINRLTQSRGQEASADKKREALMDIMRLQEELKALKTSSHHGKDVS